ncbi:MAG: LysR family transcriptional regulator [Myxococcales bacterium]|nr:LysR family transcriptional regulator [Myxococcales bacterium]
MANLQSSDTRWDDIRIFLAIHRHHTLAAAGKLAIDTSTVSRRLAALEADLGHPLFERTRTGLQPTAAAGRVLAAAEAMEAAHARMTREASEVETTAEGIVRISTAPGLSSVFVAPMLVRLRKLYPRISIELDAAVAARDLTRHEADLAIRSVRSQGAEPSPRSSPRRAGSPRAAKPVAAKLGTLTAWSAAPWITWDRDLAASGHRWVADTWSRARSRYAPAISRAAQRRRERARRGPRAGALSRASEPRPGTVRTWARERRRGVAGR